MSEPKKQTPFPLRMDVEVRAALEERATMRNTSLNTEVNQLLRLALGMESDALEARENVDIERLVEKVVRRELERYGILKVTQPDHAKESI